MANPDKPRRIGRRDLFKILGAGVAAAALGAAAKLIPHGGEAGAAPRPPLPTREPISHVPNPTSTAVNEGLPQATPNPDGTSLPTGNTPTPTRGNEDGTTLPTGSTPTVDTGHHQMTPHPYNNSTPVPDALPATPVANPVPRNTVVFGGTPVPTGR